ncbi:MAG: sarcosine oxidase subunit alpha [Beijerinckiaceae bacterium]
MNLPFRAPSGGRVDRNRPVRFTFDGRAYEGLAGDTLASALIANGVHLVGRSFKYHRPRGIVSAGADEPNALVAIGRDEAHYTPNLRATQIELFDGLKAESQNRWPSLAVDIGAMNDLFAPLLPAGFYYKTFMWPKPAWAKLYEPLIRRAAGLGRVARARDADRYTQVYAHCDVLVVGAGPTGLAAALAAASAGARVIVADEQAELGGSLLSDRSATLDGKTSWNWLTEILGELAAYNNVTLMSRTTAFGWYPHNFLGLCERITDHLSDPAPGLPRERLWQVRAAEVVIATGAIERPLGFPDNDRPGVMMSEAARTYVNRYAAIPGRRAVVATETDGAYRAALDLKAAGVHIAVIADARAAPDNVWLERARASGIPVRLESTVTGTRGRRRGASATVAPMNGKGREETFRCDLLLMSGGMTPSIHLFSQSRGRPVYDAALRAYVPGTSAERERSAGACRGIYNLAAAVADGYEAGRAAAKSACGGEPRPRRFDIAGDEIDWVSRVGPQRRAKRSARIWVDFQNDVTTKDIELAAREGFESIEHVKRYTTTGMATDQGKTSNMNALDVTAAALGKPVSDVGLTTFRPPYTPTTFGMFAGQSRGDLFDPVRHTPSHEWAAGQGAAFEDVGLWKRGHYFPHASEDMQAAVSRECSAVRQKVGMLDVSTLGKIEVVGPDAAEFLNRIYVNDWSTLEPGRAGYGLMLREDGFILDDGVVARITPDRFHVTTTTGGATRVLAVMEDYLQTEWPDLDVWLTSTTEQWAVIAVQGPQARASIAPLVEGIDLSPAAMPHMSVREGRICGLPTRLFRVSFTGELGFEINVPMQHGCAVWEAVYSAGAFHAITPYGTEAMHVLRAEKGYIIVGQETDGTVTPADVGLNWTIGKGKADFVGKRSLKRPALVAKDRKQLVGLLTVDPSKVLEEGAQIVADPAEPVPMTMLGHVTSAYWSATLGRPIALAMLRNGRARFGRRLFVPMPSETIEVEVVSSVFYDRQGARLDG